MDPILLEILENLESENIRVCLVPQSISPAIVGVIRPVLIIPQSEFTYNELYYICYHEIEHYKNHDLWLKLFLDLVTYVQWFNPFVYILREKLSLAFELSNDLEIVKDCDEEQKLEYAQVILKVARNSLKYKKYHKKISFVETKESDLERRIQLIVTRKKYSRVRQRMIIILQACGISAFVIISLLFVPEAYKNVEKDDENSMYINETNSYIIENDKKYDLYVDGVYTFSFTILPDEFKNLDMTKEDMK